MGGSSCSNFFRSIAVACATNSVHVCRTSSTAAFLEGLDGSCETPIAGLAEVDGREIRLRGEILKTDGSDALSDERRGPVEDAARIGREMAEGLLTRAGPDFFDWR